MEKDSAINMLIFCLAFGTKKHKFRKSSGMYSTTRGWKVGQKKRGDLANKQLEAETK